MSKPDTPTTATLGTPTTSGAKDSNLLGSSGGNGSSSATGPTTTAASNSGSVVSSVATGGPKTASTQGDKRPIKTCRECGKPKSKHAKGRWCQKAGEQITKKDLKERAAKNRDSKQRAQKTQLDEFIGETAEAVLKRLEILPSDDPVAKKEEEQEKKTKDEVVTIEQRISISSLFSHVKRSFYMTPNLLAKTPVAIPNVYASITNNNVIKTGASVLFGLMHSRVISWIMWPHNFIASTLITSLASTYIGFAISSSPFVTTGWLAIKTFPHIWTAVKWIDFFLFAKYAYDYLSKRTEKLLPEIQLASKVTFNNPDFSPDPDLRTDAENVRKATHDSAIVASVDHTYSMHSAIKGTALATVPEIPIVKTFSLLGLSVSFYKGGVVLHDTIRTHTFAASLEMASQLLGPSVTEVSTPMDDVWSRMSYATRGVGLIKNNRFDPLSLGEMPLLGSQLLAYHVTADYRERIMHVPVPGRSPAP